MKFCDLKCEFARWPDQLADGSRSCRTFSGLFCTKLNRIVFKDAPCAAESADEATSRMRDETEAPAERTPVQPEPLESAKPRR